MTESAQCKNDLSDEIGMIVRKFVDKLQYFAHKVWWVLETILDKCLTDAWKQKNWICIAEQSTIANASDSESYFECNGQLGFEVQQAMVHPYSNVACKRAVTRKFATGHSNITI